MEELETFENDEFYQKYSKTFVDHRSILKCEKSDKICYATKTQAKKHRKEFEQKYHQYYKVYLCDEIDGCGFYHLSTVDNKFLKNK